MTSGPDDGRDPEAGGVLGNLPRSRPGQRSAKRAEPEPAGPSPARERPGSPRGREPATGREGERPASARAATPAPQAAGGGGPVGDAIRVAGRAARLGRDVAGGVLKRLPRP